MCLFGFFDVFIHLKKKKMYRHHAEMYKSTLVTESYEVIGRVCVLVSWVFVTDANSKKCLFFYSY